MSSFSSAFMELPFYVEGETDNKKIWEIKFLKHKKGPPAGKDRHNKAGGGLYKWSPKTSGAVSTLAPSAAPGSVGQTSVQTRFQPWAALSTNRTLTAFTKSFEHPLLRHTPSGHFQTTLNCPESIYFTVTIQMSYLLAKFYVALTGQD